MIAAWVVSAMFIAHALLFCAATRWLRITTRMTVYNFKASVQRHSNRPWYVRYADWLAGKANWLSRFARRRPRVTGQVVLDLEVDTSRFSSELARSLHAPPPAVDLMHRDPHVHWGFAPDRRSVRPIPLDGGIHPALYDAGGHLQFGVHRVWNTSDRAEPVMTEEVLTAQRSRPTPTPEQVQRAFEAISGSFAEAVARMSAALMETFKQVDFLMRDLDPIYDHRRRRDERLAAKRPELTALWTSYRHKTRRRNRRRRNR